MNPNQGSLFAIVDHLREHRVPLVVIGGHAVNVHGFARATEDVDIVFRRSPESEMNLVKALLEINAFWIGSEIDPATHLEKQHPVTASYVLGKRLMMLGTDLGYLDIFDFIPSIPNEPIDDLFETVIVRSGRPFASLAWIRRMKEAADRPQDRIDLANLPMDDDA